ncbi:asparagine synthase (glutamine-hydrolyzing) [Reyranella sp.]|uniref:asparagine synthase (glutamine-hydrolyzing) n=1 Tax=Reyranella sp. TaxID=1929291 RepID=UPI003BABBF94
MCGIAGIHAYLGVAPPVDAGELARINERMAPRGPDGDGFWFDADRRIGFAHRRLAIIDLSANGAQPMHSGCGRFTITFNGEIYNYRELRAELEASGRRFRTQSDTEVLLELYADAGADMVGRLRGMFAFAIWDAEKRSLFLARDPLGIKPLYWADDGWTLRFASQAKALLAGGAIDREPDPAGIVGFHLFGSVPEPFTVWRGIRALPAGTTLTVDAAGPGTPQSYYDVAGALADRAADAEGRGGEDAARRRLADALRDSVRHHLVADVPVAVFLSAGLDSGALLGTMAELGAGPVTAVTLSFAEFKDLPVDEAPLAAEVARQYGARHVVRTVDRAEFERDLPAILDAMDLPTIDGINTWFVAKAAHEAGIKVALSGLGADECFGGYPSFTDVPRSVHWLRPLSWIPGLGEAARWTLSAARGAGVAMHPKTPGVLEYGGSWAGAYLLRRSIYMPWELETLLDPEMLREGLRRLAPLSHIASELRAGRALGDFDRVAALESTLYMRNQLLRDADWAGMAHSLEIRVPYVDPFFLAALPPGEVLARIDAKASVGGVPSPALPPAVRNRRKTGFVTPVGRWLDSVAGGPLPATTDFSAASRRWAHRVWQHGWMGPVTA